MRFHVTRATRQTLCLGDIPSTPVQTFTSALSCHKSHTAHIVSGDIPSTPVQTFTSALSCHKSHTADIVSGGYPQHSCTNLYQCAFMSQEPHGTHCVWGISPALLYKPLPVRFHVTRATRHRLKKCMKHGEIVYDHNSKH